MTKHLVQRAFEEIGEFEIRGYSGRSMYGAECLGVDFDGGIGAVVAALVEYTVGMEHDDVRELADALRGMRTDSMGRGQILYFPNVPFAAFDDGDENAEPDYAEMTADALEQLGDHGRTEAIQAGAKAELLRRSDR